MAAKLHATCPHCERSLSYDPHQAGRTAKCRCGCSLTLPDGVDLGFIAPDPPRKASTASSTRQKIAFVAWAGLILQSIGAGLLAAFLPPIQVTAVSVALLVVAAWRIHAVLIAIHDDAD